MRVTFLILPFVALSGATSLNHHQHSITNKKKSGPSLSSIINRKLDTQTSAKDFCADLSDLKAHVDKGFDDFFGDDPIITSNGYVCTCTSQEPIMLDCTLTYTYSETDSTFINKEMATFVETNGAQVLSTTGWSEEDSITGEKVSETFEYCDDGENLCSCGTSGDHECQSCSVCANGKHVTLYDCSVDSAYSTSCDDSYSGSFLNNDFTFPKIANNSPSNAEDFCADLSYVKDHVDKEFTLLFGTEPIITSDGYACTCISQEPIMLDCTLTYTYNDADSTFINKEMATFVETNGAQVLSTTGWSEEDSITGEKVSETFEYCDDGENLCSCGTSGDHECQSCSVCANGKHVTLYDCSVDSAYSTSCDDSYSGAFLNYLAFPTIVNPTPATTSSPTPSPTPSGSTHLTASFVLSFTVTFVAILLC